MIAEQEKQVAIGKLQLLIREASAVKENGNQAASWNHKASRIFANLFGESRKAPCFNRTYPISEWGTGNVVKYSVHDADVYSAVELIQAVIWEINEYGLPSNTANVALHPVRQLESIAARFHNIARALRQRHDGRSTLDIKDEYDMQDLLRALLELSFQDIRQEEWTPSYAGKSARVDFLLKNENIVVECKMTRHGLNHKKLGEELIIDRERYRSHPDCSFLFVFVYDPDGRISNPRGLENDLSELDGVWGVRVIIAP